MPPAAFFVRFGMYVVPKFLAPDVCARVCAEMRAASATPATVRDHDDVYAVDDATRRTQVTQVSDATQALVLERLSPLKPVLERHFGVRAAGWRNLQFLLYRPGDFFVAHQDSSDAPNAGAVAADRRVSTIVFLNAESPESSPGTYGGGALTFYRLLASPALKNIGLPLTPEIGMLIAFRPDTFHAVTPVTHGERCTIVTWLAD